MQLVSHVLHIFFLLRSFYTEISALKLFTQDVQNHHGREHGTHA